MAIDLATGFNIGSKDAIDERQVLTLEQMKNLDESIYPDKYFAICKDDSMLYVYNVNNLVDAKTGKFRKVSSNESVDPSIFQKINDDTLITEDKTIVGAINELKTGVSSISVPTQVSQLTNDSGYITSDEVEGKVDKTSILTTIDNLATDDQVYSTKATYDLVNTKANINHTHSTSDITDLSIPTKVSDLVNDSNFITSIPEEYITETELNAKGYLTSHQDISGLQTKTDNNLTTTSKEVVGAINEVKDMADLILDTEVRIDKTYSSSKIYTAIQDAIDSSKSFTLNEIGKMSSASYKVVTSTAEITDGKIIYLLENGATYDMYIVEEAGTVTKIGDTAIDLSSYLKTTDAESTYLKKTDATTTYVAQTSFNNHITDTVAHLTQFEKNKLLTTDNITSTINNSSDNTQVPTAKATYNLANTKADARHTHIISDIKGLSIPSNVSELTNDAGYISEVINNLTSTDTDKPLSANQGKVLKDYVDDKVNETIANPTELDTDKYIKNGFYSIGDTTKRTNLPIQRGGTLLVYYAGHYVIQEYILNENLRRFMRRSTNKGTNWSAWQELATMNKIGSTDISSIGDGTVTGAIDTINTSLESYSIPINTYMELNHYLAIKIKVHDMNYSFNISDRSGNIYEGTFFSYNGSFSVQIKKINNSSIKNGYILGFRQYKVSNSKIYLVMKVSDYSHINGVINTSSVLKPNIEILVNDDSTLWDKGTDIVVKELATMDKVPESVTNPAELDTNKFNKNGYYSIGDVRSRTNLPVQQVGTLLVFYAGHYVIQEYILNENLRTFIRRSTNKGANWSAWQEFATMDRLNYSTVADVPKTTVIPVFPNGVAVASGGASINYIVRNGWCNVDFVFNIASAIAFPWTDIATGLPKPANSVNILLTNDGGKINRTIPIKINSTGSVSSRVATEISTTDWWAGNVSYPVAE